MPDVKKYMAKYEGSVVYSCHPHELFYDNQNNFPH